MSIRDFIHELGNISAHLHGLDFTRFYCSVTSPGHVKVYMDGLGFFDGAPETVLPQMVAAAKEKTRR